MFPSRSAAEEQYSHQEKDYGTHIKNAKMWCVIRGLEVTQAKWEFIKGAQLEML